MVELGPDTSDEPTPRAIQVATLDDQKRVLQAVRRAVQLDDRNQKEIGRDAEITPDHISRYLNGRQQLRSDSLERLVRVLGIVVQPPSE